MRRCLACVMIVLLVFVAPAFPAGAAGFELPEDLYTHINRLDRDSQDIIKLRFYEELSLLEIAQIMEMNLNTVKSKLYRGLRALKVSIEEAGI